MKFAFKCFGALVTLFYGLSFAAYSGTPQAPAKVDGCYQIASAENLYGFARLMNDTANGLAQDPETCAKLTSDIVINDNVLKNDTLDDSRTDFIPWEPIEIFSGSFDGQGHSISGLYYDDSRVYSETSIPAGLFRKISPADTSKLPSPRPSVKNLGIVDSYFNARGIVGAITGEATYLEISRCYNKGIAIGGFYTGGLVGWGIGISISESYNEGFVYARDSYYAYSQTQLYAGGIIGMIYTKDNYIKNVYNAGPTKAYKAAGGLIGRVAMEGTRLFLNNSFNVGTINNGYSGDLIANQIKTTYVETSSTFNIRSKATDTDSLRTAEDFASGLIALVLQNSPDGNVWGQNVGTDTHPTLTGQIKGYSGNAKISKLTFKTYEGDTLKYPGGYVEGFELKLPVSTRKGYVFAGWYSNENAEGISVKKISAQEKGDITLTAKWWGKPTFKDNCYEIASEGDLYAFAAIVNGTDGMEKNVDICGKLTQDIVLNSVEKRQWTPINYFQGTFDGQGHSIFGLYLNDSDQNYVGLFGRNIKGSAEKPVTIKNLGLVDSYITASWYVGAIVGSQTGKLILENVYSTGSMRSSNYGGGLVGYVYGNTTIINSYSASNTNNAAGLVGGLNSSATVSIINSFNFGSYRDYIFINADLVGKKDSTNVVSIIHSFNLNGKTSDYTGEAKDYLSFADGSLAKALHDYNEDGIDGSIWGEKVGVDTHPVLSGKITFSGDPIVPQTSSSSTTESSSSNAESSSSTTEESSSSEQSISLKQVPVVSYARIKTHGSSLVVENFAGSVFVFDMNGNLVKQVHSNGFIQIRLPRTGAYIIRTGGLFHRITLGSHH